MKREMTPDEFWSAIDKSDGPDACWPWTRATRSDGRGRIIWNGRATYVYRIAWQLANDRVIADGMYACHTCDNPQCANPRHIFIGTCGDNLRDAADKKRLRLPPPRCGLTNHQAKVSDSSVIEVRRLYATGRFSQRELARMFGVGQTAIGAWVRGETRRVEA